MNKHINKKKLEPKKKISLVLPFGLNRHARRSKVANDRLEPRRKAKAKLSKYIFDEKARVRKERQEKLEKRLSNKLIK